MLLLDAFRVHALHSPGNVAIRATDGEPFTYRQIWNVSELLGAHLIEKTEQGLLTSGEPVTIFGWDEPLLLSCQLACAKSSHPYTLVAFDSPVPASGRVVLVASGKTIERVKIRSVGFGDTIFLDAERMLSYIVPGMTDDFSCGCGTDDCAHGPFLQECMPQAWFAGDGVFAVGADSSATEIAVAEHDALLTEVLMGENDSDSADDYSNTVIMHNNRSGMETIHSEITEAAFAPLNLCYPHLAAALATGREVFPEVKID